LPHNLSLALGSGAVSPWQLAAAYCVFANGGYRVSPFLIDRIETLRGETIFKAAPAVACPECEKTAAQKVTTEGPAAVVARSPDAAEVKAPDPAQESTPDMAVAEAAPAPKTGIAPRVVGADNVWIMNSMTRDVIRFGTGRKALVLNRSDLSGKTGTTNDQRDAWFAGFNSGIVTISWVGFDKFDPLGSLETGARAALPMWIDFMRVALQDIPEQIPERPEGLVNVRIDPKTGKLADAGTAGPIFEVFKAGTVPSGSDTLSGLEMFNDSAPDDSHTEQLF